MTNGTGKSDKTLLYTLLTVLLSLVIALTSAWAVERNSIDERLTQRITALEAKFASIDEHMKSQDEKLDRLLVGLGLERKR